MGATAFNAVERPVAICSRVTIELTSHALWNVVFIRVRRFKLNNFVLYSLNGVDILIIRGRFNINKEDAEGFLCQSVFDIYDVSHCMSQGTKFLLDVEVEGVMKVFEYYTEGSFFFQLVGVVIYVSLLAMRDYFSIGVRSWADEFNYVVGRAFCVELLFFYDFCQAFHHL